MRRTEPIKNHAHYDFFCHKNPFQRQKVANMAGVDS